MPLNEIVFLGTGGGRFSVGRQLRASGGIILRISGIQFHLDPGPGALVRAREYNINPRETSVLLASNSMLDHCNDINIMIEAMTHSGLDKSGILLASRSVVYGNDNRRPYLTKDHRNQIEKYLALDAGHKVRFNSNINITALKTKHTDPHGIGFKFSNGRFTLGYSSDTEYSPEVVEDLKGCNILILNNLSPFGYKDKNNLSSEDSVKIIKEINPKLVIITHFGQKMIEKDPIYQARQIQIQSKVQTIAARDGMSIDPITHVATHNRKTMNF
ncbi:MBL fold metallo-hydrolase [archaeon]|jgi:ribonuclease BN (tRNA processing enzyme)|nr:MBL fold metallo-hydrolase [archaeon]MBT6824181.1 MBL fold metallo-hydrolase [archaeon]MBT7106975.1 MBL fold metallo-hydrolase [archaeon]MBT7297587.1 MBL fold metallo-hydrolase [archaeon]